jgi:hypothetical protein
VLPYLRELKPPTNRLEPIRLGWSQFAAVSAGLLGTWALAVLVVRSPYEWAELYYRELVVPQRQARYGFRLGEVSAVRDGRLYFQSKGIVEVSPGGAFSRIGVRVGDAPFGFHGGAFTMMHDALETAERGGFAAFQVLNVYELEAGLYGGRTIPVYPRVRDVPVSLAQKELPFPNGPLTLLRVRIDHGPSDSGTVPEPRAPTAQSHLIQHQIHDHARHRHIQPDRQRPARDRHMPLEP